MRLRFAAAMMLADSPRPVHVHLLGPEKELALWPLFGELVHCTHLHQVDLALRPLYQVLLFQVPHFLGLQLSAQRRDFVVAHLARS